MSNDYDFIPEKENFEKSNIYKFMSKFQIYNYRDFYNKSISEIEWFWEQVSQDIGIIWDKKYSKILDSSMGIPHSKWFIDGKTNIYKSSVEKFAKINPEKIAYHFLSENKKNSSITFSDLEKKSNQIASHLKKIGIKKGDVIGIFLPMIEEAIISILACAKIGVIQTVIFSGYSSDSLHIRLKDCNAKILIASDGFFRKGKPISQKKIIENAIRDTKIEKTIIVRYQKIDEYVENEKILFFDSLINEKIDVVETEIMDSEDPLFILYTSGTTGKPKGVIQPHGGFSVFAGHQSSYLIDMKSNDILFWPADIGWITGLVWNVYGLLLIGGTSIIYDGALDYPDNDHIWELIEKYNVTIFGISPTAVRTFKKNGVNPREKFNLDKIKNIPTTGEPIDKDSWNWLFEKIGNKKIPIMNLSGGTEIGGAMLSVLPGMNLKISTVGMPVPGMNLDVVDENGVSIKGENGYLVIKSPWPSMSRSLLNDDQKFLDTYWSKFEDIWFHGDYVLIDKNDLWYMQGRADDVINVSGHRMSTAEIEHTVIGHEKISDAAAIAIPDSITGEAIIVFFVPEKHQKTATAEEITGFISDKIGKLAKPKYIIEISDLPKTRTGKILRRVLKSKILGEPLGDLSSLENPQILDEIKKIV